MNICSVSCVNKYFLSTSQIFQIINCKQNDAMVPDNIRNILPVSYTSRWHFSCHPLLDIHKVAQEIAAVTNTDLHKVRLTLISQWLPSSASKQSDGESVSLSLSVVSEKKNVLSDCNIGQCASLMIMFYLQTVTFNFENLKLAEQSMMSDAEDEHINLKRSGKYKSLAVSTNRGSH